MIDGAGRDVNAIKSRFLLGKKEAACRREWMGGITKCIVNSLKGGEEKGVRQRFELESSFRSLRFSFHLYIRSPPAKGCILFLGPPRDRFLAGHNRQLVDKKQDTSFSDFFCFPSADYSNIITQFLWSAQGLFMFFLKIPEFDRWVHLDSRFAPLFSDFCPEAA
jgi:hypothetical protein